QTYVFNENGQPLSYEHFKQRQFDKVVAGSGLRKIKFHSLRHTYASHFVMSGGKIQELQLLLGHSKIETTMIYAQVSESHLEKLASVVEFGKYLNKQETEQKQQTTG
ncbi:MAG: tyrosine-type recombinase/integrase, partial [Pseudobdellovibrio sp.]